MVAHAGGLDCSELGCSVHRPCYKPQGQSSVYEAGCAALHTVPTVNAFQNLEERVECPTYYEPCAVIVQNVGKGALKNNGKTCV